MIVSALDKGFAVCVAFLDLRKVFDSPAGSFDTFEASSPVGCL